MHNYQIPILFLIFNRPNTTKIVFNKIREQKPNKLFIASDGPRKEKEGEFDIVCNLRNEIVNSIDWPCQINTLFREENLGCKVAVSDAITWYFENVDMGIILEDDVIPETCFFTFCQELLVKYKNADHVFSICGNNILNKFSSKNSYLFSNGFRSWGWATWKESWSKLDLELKVYKDLVKKDKLNKYYPGILERTVIRKKLATALEKNSSWAIPWNVTHHINNALTIIPSVNLIKNIGFSNEYSTHTKENRWDSKFLDKESHKLELPLKHPSKIAKNKAFMNKYFIMELIRFSLKKIF